MINPNFNYDDLNALNDLINNGNWNLLGNVSPKLFLMPYDSTRTYLDVIIEKTKDDQTLVLDEIVTSLFRFEKTITPEIIANVLFKVVKSSNLKNLPKYNYILLQSELNQKTTLDWLLEMDKDFTISSIIPRISNIDEEKCKLFLQSRGIDKYPIHRIDGTSYSDAYLKNYNSKLFSECYSEDEDLLQELKELFYNDRVSGKGEVDLLIDSLRYFTSIGRKEAKLELRQLIELKKTEDIIILHEPNRSSDAFDLGVVFSKRPFLESLYHELGHLFYWGADDFTFDINIIVPIFNNIRNNPNIYVRIKEHINKYNEIQNQINNGINPDDIISYYDSFYDNEVGLKVMGELSKLKEKLRLSVKDKYPPEVLDTLLEKRYSFDEYIKQRKEIEKQELSTTIMMNEYSYMAAIGDILDAVFQGKLFDGAINYENEPLRIRSGHGINYYSKSDGNIHTSHSIDELIANYSSIVNSPYKDQALSYLRYLVGDELVDYLSDLFENKILHSDQIDLERNEGYAK